MQDWKRYFRLAISHVGSQPKLAAAMGCSQSKVSWLLLQSDHISGDDALKVDRATGGAVSASDLRPDLWPSKRHVPAPSEDAA